MTGCNYPNWNLARTHLLFAKRATGVSTKAGRPAEAAGFGGWGITLAAPQRPLTELWASAGAAGSRRLWPLQSLPLPPPGSRASWIIRNFQFQVSRLWVLQAGFAESYLCLSVCLALSVCLSSCLAVSLLSLMEVLVLIK